MTSTMAEEEEYLSLSILSLCHALIFCYISIFLFLNLLVYPSLSSVLSCVLLFSLHLYFPIIPFTFQYYYFIYYFQLSAFFQLLYASFRRVLHCVSHKAFIRVYQILQNGYKFVQESGFKSYNFMNFLLKDYILTLKYLKNFKHAHK